MGFTKKLKKAVHVVQAAPVVVQKAAKKVETISDKVNTIAQNPLVTAVCATTGTTGLQQGLISGTEVVSKESRSVQKTTGMISSIFSLFSGAPVKETVEEVVEVASDTGVITPGVASASVNAVKTVKGSMSIIDLILSFFRR